MIRTSIIFTMVPSGKKQVECYRIVVRDAFRSLPLKILNSDGAQRSLTLCVSVLWPLLKDKLSMKDDVEAG